MDFDSLYDQGFARVAAVTLPVHLADPRANAEEIIAAARACGDDGIVTAVFPELSVTGYSLDDLLLQQTLLNGAREALESIRLASADLLPILVVGAPLSHGDALYNCAVLIHRGRYLGVTPKRHLPSYREFYEKRYFSTFDGIDTIALGGEKVPFGNLRVEADDVPGFRLAVEVCEDLWVPVPPSSLAALQGATVVANLSASPITVGRARRREELVRSHSSSTLTAYIYTAAGHGESSTDLSWDGQSLIYEAGAPLAASARFERGTSITTADIDLQALTFERLQQNSFADNARAFEGDYCEVVTVTLDPPRRGLELRRPVARFPFVPGDQDRLDSDCYEAFNIQVGALARRMESIGSPKLVIGVSGGLDSTHALLVCARAMDLLDRPRTDILAYTMPGFGTSTGTRTNAELLSRALGVSFEELDIRPTAQQMLSTLGHPYSDGADQFDVTFENVQAGLRTDYLFRLANHHHGLVVGTGDLSELALGWCTYGVGDQMSHYGVNAGLPKTMIQHLIRWVSRTDDFAGELSEILESILATEISPELIPAGFSGTVQSTQAAIGPYELQDFTLYHLLRRGFGPARIAYLAQAAWGEKYSREEIVKWLGVFHKRFFANQFKRSAIPNGPKLMAGGALSPRGDWRMPSDALSATWLREIEQLEAAL